MSGRQAHILQARHNEALARELVGAGYRFKDWSIVAAFYAAVHYFEARLHDSPRLVHPEVGRRIFHTDDSIPLVSGRYKYPPHAWRYQLLRTNFARSTRYAYRSLRVASEKARYHGGVIMVQTAHEHFTDRDVDQCVITHLGRVKSGLGVS